MPHKKDYTKEEVKELKKKGIKPGSEKAHKEMKKKMMSEGGYMMG